ncbi:g5831 [Coccomyxa elongata]
MALRPRLAALANQMEQREAELAASQTQMEQREAELAEQKAAEESFLFVDTPDMLRALLQCAASSGRMTRTDARCRQDGPRDVRQAICTRGSS